MVGGDSGGDGFEVMVAVTGPSGSASPRLDWTGSYVRIAASPCHATRYQPLSLARLALLRQGEVRGAPFPWQDYMPPPPLQPLPCPPPLPPQVLSVCSVQYKCVTDAQKRKSLLPGR